MTRRVSDRTLDELAAVSARMLRSLAHYLRPELSEDEMQTLLDEWSQIERCES